LSKREIAQITKPSGLEGRGKETLPGFFLFGTVEKKKLDQRRGAAVAGAACPDKRRKTDNK